MHRSAWLMMLLRSVTVLLTQCPGFLGTSALTWDFHQAFSIILLTARHVPSVIKSEGCWGAAPWYPLPHLQRLQQEFSSSKLPLLGYGPWCPISCSAAKPCSAFLPLLRFSELVLILIHPSEKKKKYSFKVLQENGKGTEEQNLKMRTARWLRSGRISSKNWQSFVFWRQLCHRSGRLQRGLGQTEKWFKYWSKYQNYAK